MEKKQVAIIGTVGLPANYGGFETLVNYLTLNMSDDYKLTVYCSGKTYTQKDRPDEYNGAKLVYLPFKANGIQSIIYDIISVFHALFYADVLLILGVPSAVILPFVKWFTNKKIIISIDGLEWKRDKWNGLAKLYLRLCEKLAIRFSHVDISDNEAIQDYTASNYKTLSNVIEYGADHTLKVPLTEELYTKYPFLRKPYAFKVCRIEPENNIEMILKAFSQCPDQQLVLIGNWENSAYGKECLERYGQFENLHLLPPIYDQEILDAIRGNSQVYIHGHSAGGTNPSLVEAMYLARPIICFGVKYNRATTENKAEYFDSTNELIQKLEAMIPSKLESLAAKMKEIAMRRYTWKVICSKYQFLIDKLAFKSTKLITVPALSNINNQELNSYELGHFRALNSIYENN